MDRALTATKAEHPLEQGNHCIALFALAAPRDANPKSHEIVRAESRCLVCRLGAFQGCECQEQRPPNSHARPQLAPLLLLRTAPQSSDTERKASRGRTVRSLSWRRQSAPALSEDFSKAPGSQDLATYRSEARRRRPSASGDKPLTPMWLGRNVAL